MIGKFEPGIPNACSKISKAVYIKDWKRKLCNSESIIICKKKIMDTERQLVELIFVREPKF